MIAIGVALLGYALSSNMYGGRRHPFGMWFLTAALVPSTVSYDSNRGVLFVGFAAALTEHADGRT
jgi:hypothetical protein